ncbi:MAG: YbaN family protein [Spirochaetales bacterium]|nr:YbaN family protein [Spirochaetales bacterium]
MKQMLLIMAGSASLSLGVVGIFLPVLPTTPFLLLSAACYLRSSRRLYSWLINHPVLGLYIRSYIEYGAISRKAKIVSIVMLWLVITSTAVFFIDFLWLRIVLVCIAIGVTVYLLSKKTLTKEMLIQNMGDRDGNAGV